MGKTTTCFNDLPKKTTTRSKKDEALEQEPTAFTINKILSYSKALYVKKTCSGKIVEAILN